ncbi:MAG: histidine kinase dimerization/phospho-acceptor domain-containing protein, partial [Acidobacteriota bacterium]
MSIKAKQVAGVTTIVVLIVSVLSVYHLATLADLTLRETASRGQMLAQAIFQRAREVVAQGGPDPYAALRDDGGVRSILESSMGFSRTVTYAAIVDKDGMAVAHNFRALEGQRMPPQEDLDQLVTAGKLAQLQAVYSDRTFEVRTPMLAGDQEFGVIRIGVSTLLVREELRGALRLAAGTIVVALIVSTLLAMLLSNWILRPIHVIQSGLTRLGRGELDVTLDLPEQEFRDLGSSFDAVSAQLSAMGRAGTSAPEAADARRGSGTDLESVMDSLEDAVALFSPVGELIFSNAAMKVLLRGPLAHLPSTDPVRQLVERTLAGRKSAGPVSVSSAELRALASGSDSDPTIPPGDVPQDGATEPTERLLMSHAIEDTGGRFLGAMLVSRNIGYLSQVHSTLNYSRKLAALGRLMAGVAHEVKNPLNAMTIHLELLKNKLASQSLAAAQAADRTIPAGAGRGLRPSEGAPSVTKHVEVIAAEI